MLLEVVLKQGAAYKIILFAVIVVAWIALDQWAKSLFAGLVPGQTLGTTLGGLVNLMLVHNTGAAWGIFADNTFALGVFSVVVVAVLVVYFIVNIRTVNIVQTVGFALICAGGIGNAIDRFVQGYVTDFIAVTFIDFPVFNVADIGVTCGVAVLIIGLLIGSRSSGSSAEEGR